MLKSSRHPLGDGVNSINYRRSENPFSKPAQPPKPVKDIKEEFKIVEIQDSEEFARHLGVGANLAMSGISYNLNADFNYTSDTHSKSNSCYIFVRGERLESVVTLENRALSQEAKRLLATRDGAKKFRSKYGDYFVSAVHIGARIEATIEIRSTSSENATEIKAAISGKYATVKTKAEFEKFTKEIEAKYSCNVTLVTRGALAPESTVKDPNTLRDYTQKVLSQEELTNPANCFYEVTPYTTLEELSSPAVQKEFFDRTEQSADIARLAMRLGSLRQRLLFLKDHGPEPLLISLGVKFVELVQLDDRLKLDIERLKNIHEELSSNIAFTPPKKLIDGDYSQLENSLKRVIFYKITAQSLLESRRIILNPGPEGRASQEGAHSFEQGLKVSVRPSALSAGLSGSGD